MGNGEGSLTDSSTQWGGIISALRAVWAAWKWFGRFVGDLVARVVLSVFYFTVFVPFAVISRLLYGSLGAGLEDGSSKWLERGTTALTLDEARRQF